MTRTPIAYDRIQVGDTVEAESNGMTTRFAIRRVDGNRVYADTDDAFLYADLNAWFLINRPTLPVTLPTEPTLGWVTCAPLITGPPQRHLGVTFDAGSCVRLARCDSTIKADRVTAFTPASAVPTEALGELRKYRDSLDPEPMTPAVRRIDKFLTAVTEANS
ncbi:hypothetical protein [Aeromicrobium sp. UC242_57]|uniref:hypothetical protein n=1 Tax=Aeromicrobium sp. UC242_57 TaxID=3374624 RepID=UPI0037B90044